ncbi:hypothetical protein [Allonocardiopsis opalescens]|uniref:non-specific serine/threonine protein kinase n=1 Tax=Allonocardiopsis opalescens TaxID=1144618 RepID=A0A2T0Q436_9ACTN|nr:hypothetical protein [Allonocardiopsis opalescens]PRX98566.1 protein kinase-like protein [Allonocardiopsis opalescens]
MTQPIAEEELRYLRADDASVEITRKVRHVGELVSPPASSLRRRLVREQGSERLLMQLRMPEDPSPRERMRALEQLDGEILAGVRLARLVQRSGADGHPAVLSRLVGYGDAPGNPFALLDPYIGEPLAALLDRRALFEDERMEFQRGLLEALAWTAAAGVVHRAVSPATVRWDADLRRVQLCDFSRATVADTPRTPVGVKPWASPDQRDGVGFADPRDDVWSAGLVLFQALHGHDPGAFTRLPLSEHPDFAERYQAVFAGTAAQRPTAATLLERIAPRVAPVRVTVGEELAKDRAAFRRLRGNKLGEPEPVAGARPRADTVPPPGPARSQGESGGTSGPLEPSPPGLWLPIGVVIVVLAAGAVVAYLLLAR